MPVKGRPCLFNPGTELMGIGAAHVAGHSRRYKVIRRQVSSGWGSSVQFCKVSLPEEVLPRAVSHSVLAKWRFSVTYLRMDGIARGRD